MFRILFFILVVISSIALSQTVQKTEAVKLYEFERATNGYVKMKMDNFYVELNNNPSAQGFIINYGTDREIAVREKQIRVSISWRKYDASRITFVRAGFRDVIKTELWIVPPGAEHPLSTSDGETKPQNISEPWRFEKLATNSESIYQKTIAVFFERLREQKNTNGYFLINAGDADFKAFEEKVRKNDGFASINTERIFFIKGKQQSPLSCELWLVPKGTELPKFTTLKAEKVSEFGKISNIEWQKQMKVIGNLAKEIKDEGSQLFIINYGTKQDILIAERLTHKYLYENCRDCFGYSNFKINYLRGDSKGKARRTFWIVPEGAEPPKP